MKSYDFECDLDEVNVMVTKNLVCRKVSSKWINVVHTERLGKVPSPTVEVTFDQVRHEDFGLMTLLRIDHSVCIYLIHILCF